MAESLDMSDLSTFGPIFSYPGLNATDFVALAKVLNQHGAREDEEHREHRKPSLNECFLDQLAHIFARRKGKDTPGQVTATALHEDDGSTSVFIAKNAGFDDHDKLFKNVLQHWYDGEDIAELKVTATDYLKPLLPDSSTKSIITFAEAKRDSSGISVHEKSKGADVLVAKEGSLSIQDEYEAVNSQKSYKDDEADENPPPPEDSQSSELAARDFGSANDEELWKHTLYFCASRQFFYIWNLAFWGQRVNVPDRPVRAGHVAHPDDSVRDLFALFQKCFDLIEELGCSDSIDAVTNFHYSKPTANKEPPSPTELFREGMKKEKNQIIYRDICQKAFEMRRFRDALSKGFSYEASLRSWISRIASEEAKENVSEDQARSVLEIERKLNKRIEDDIMYLEYLGRLRAAVEALIDFRNSTASKDKVVKVELVVQGTKYEYDAYDIQRTIRSWPHARQLVNINKPLPTDGEHKMERYYFHCELQLLYHFAKTQHRDPSVYPSCGFFGCSKRSCWLCYKILKGYRKFRTSSTHGKVYYKCAIPFGNGSFPGSKLLTAGLMDVQRQMAAWSLRLTSAKINEMTPRGLETPKSRSRETSPIPSLVSIEVISWSDNLTTRLVNSRLLLRRADDSPTDLRCPAFYTPKGDLLVQTLPHFYRAETGFPLTDLKTNVGVTGWVEWKIRPEIRLGAVTLSYYFLGTWENGIGDIGPFDPWVLTPKVFYVLLQKQPGKSVDEGEWDGGPLSLDRLRDILVQYMEEEKKNMAIKIKLPTDAGILFLPLLHHVHEGLDEAITKDKATEEDKTLYNWLEEQRRSIFSKRENIPRSGRTLVTLPTGKGAYMPPWS